MKIEMNKSNWQKFLAHNYGRFYEHGTDIGIISPSTIAAAEFLPIGSISVIKHQLCSMHSDELIEIVKDIGLVAATVKSENENEIILVDDTYTVEFIYDASGFEGGIVVKKEYKSFSKILYQDTARLYQMLHDRGYAFNWHGWDIRNQIEAKLIKWEE